MIKVSVIVPVYNGVKFIDLCANSLLQQTYHNFEIIFVNDGSTDQSYEMLKHYQDNTDLSIEIINKENGGQASARNLGIQKANGEFVCFVDIDDYVSEHMLEKLVKAQEETESDIVWCNAYLVKNNNNIGMLDTNMLCNENVCKEYMINNAGPWRKLIRKSLLINNDLIFPLMRFYEDVAIVPAYGVYTDKITYVNDPLYYYVLHEGSTMHQLTYNKKLECIFEAMEYLNEKCKGDYREELEYIYIDHLLHAASLRFFAFDEGKVMLNKVVQIMSEQFPRWNKNTYYKKRDWKYQLVCKLFYHKRYGILKRLLKKGC